ncbi:MAG: cytochrome c [Acidobacteriia bacterium]|nr:cytochrome c [Terriglobia bacterium]
MTSRKLLGMLFLIALCLCITLPQSAFAEDGAALYKSKCAACHGPEGQGKIGTALKGTSLTEDQISALLTAGDAAKKPPHKKPMNGVSADDAKAVAAFVKTLK